ncbi:hypothetical protein BH11CYA1_BH11CYA1_33630 [soil metagenome]
MKKAKFEVLDHTQKNTEAEKFEQQMSGLIIGQDAAIGALADIHQLYLSKLAPKDRPLGILLFLGPTGSGKTRTVEAAAETVFGNANAVMKIDCAEFQHSHEIAKLIGSPPGYLGHRETSPLLTQENLDRCHTAKDKITFVLFDEIEKASDSLWNLLLGILDKAKLTLGDNRQVNFSRCVVVMTSNLGAREMQEVVKKKLGFAPAAKESLSNEKISSIALEAARKKFSPEFMNRIDKVVAFKTLSADAIKKILALVLNDVQNQIFEIADAKFSVSVTQEAIQLILAQEIDPRYNARPLKRLVKDMVVVPLGNLITTGQARTGDDIVVDVNRKNTALIFKRVTKVALAPAEVETAGSSLLDQVMSNSSKNNLALVKR